MHQFVQQLFHRKRPVSIGAHLANIIVQLVTRRRPQELFRILVRFRKALDVVLCLIELIQLVIQNCQRQEHLRFLIGIELLMERQRVHLVFHIGIQMHQLIADAEIIVLAQFQQALPFVDRPAHHAAGN